MLMNPSDGATPTIRFARRVLVLQTVLLLAPWLLVAVLIGPLVWREPPQRLGQDEPAAQDHSSANAAISETDPQAATEAESSSSLTSNDIVLGEPGPWGQLELLRVGIELPLESVFLDADQQKPTRWYFGGWSQADVAELFQSFQLDAGLLSELNNSAAWKIEPEGVTVSPKDDVVLALTPADRAKLYTILVSFPENEAQRKAFPYNPAYLDERIELSELSPQSIGLFQRLLYPRDGLLLLADLLPALRQLPNRDEQIQFVKAVSRKMSVLVKLRITPDLDVDELAEYWGTGGRSKDLRALLRTLKRVEGGCTLDVAHLLPGFARRRIYTFPYVTSSPDLAYQDCHWTALNFFNDLPEDRFADLNVVSETVASDYYQISAPSQLGDLVFLADNQANVVHSAVYLADDLVFTKNGVRFTEPWTLMKMGDMTAVYNATRPTSDPLKVLYYRRNEL